jgi:hypothetical protein
MKKLLLLLLAPLSLPAADISGSWYVNLVIMGEEVAPAKLDIKIDGEKLTGTLNELKLEGTLRNDVVSFTATRPNGNQFGTFEGRAQGNELRGTARIDNDNVGWVARRASRRLRLRKHARLIRPRSIATSPERFRPRYTSTPATPSAPPPSMPVAAMPKANAAHWAGTLRPVPSM